MVSRTQIQVAITLAVVIWGAMLLVDGVALKGSYLRPYSAAVGGASVLMIVYDRWLWRRKLLRRLSHRPDIRGTWKGVLQSSWKDPSTSQQVGPTAVFLAVKETYSTIAVSLLTAESSSVAVASSLEVAKGEASTVWITYVNTPGILIQSRSRPHHGAMKLEIHGSPPQRLRGSYWTARETSGEINFEGRSRKIHTDFAGASVDSYD